jgi:hypothetical protein
MDDRCHDCPHKIDCLLGEDLCDNAQYWLDQVQNNPYHEVDDNDYDDSDWYDEDIYECNEDEDADTKNG